MSNAWRVFFVGVVLVLMAVVATLIIVSASHETRERDAGDLRHAEAEEKAEDENLTLLGRPVVPEPDEADSPVPADGTPKGRLLQGRVRDGAGEDVAGALVRVRRVSGEVCATIGETLSRADGTYAVSIEALRELSAANRAESALVVQAMKAGYQPSAAKRVRPLPHDPSGGGNLACDLVLERGAMVRGRVVDPAGHAVPDATTILVDAASKTVGVSYRDPTGRFALGAAVPGTYVVWAHSRVHGLGTSEPFECTADGSVDLGELVLGAVPTIEGRVLYEDGTPIAGVQMYANRVRDDADPHAGLDGNAIPFQASAETGDDGRFRMLTFRPGTYRIHLSHVYAPDVTREARTGDRDVEFRLSLHRITLRLLDSRGEPVPGAGRSVHGWMPGHIEEYERVVRGELAVGELWKSADTSSAGSSSYDDGREVLFVPPGSGWVFSFSVEGMPPIEHAMRAPMEGHESEVVLRVAAEEAVGKLKIEVRDEHGEPVGPFSYDVRSVFGGRLAEGTCGGNDEAPIRVRAGRLKLQVWTGADTNWLEKECRAHSPYFPMRTDVEVPVRGVAKAALRAHRGGWIRLVLERPQRTAEDDLKGANVEVRRAEADAAWVSCRMFLYPGAPLRGRSWLTMEGSAHVEVRLGGLYEPGRCELRVTVRDFKTVSVPVDVRAGETATVRVVLEPE